MRKKNLIGKKIVFTLNLDPYNQTVIVIVNGIFDDAIKIFKKNKKNENAAKTLKHIEKHMDKYMEESSELGQGAKLFTELPKGYVMMLNHQDSWVDTVGLVVHEAIHLSHYVLQRAGFTLSPDSEEAYTYLTEMTTERILHRIY